MATAKEPVVEFQTRLRMLRDNVGVPSYRELDTYAALLGEGRLPTSTVSDLLTGTRLPRWRTVQAFVRVCQRHATVKFADLPRDLFDLERWRADYDRAIGAQGDAAPSRSVTGLSVWAATDFPPSAAGVHRAVTSTDPVGDSAQRDRPPPNDKGWRLPEYVKREHDVELCERLTAAAAHGGGFVLLTGRSCTGKTRSAWEAIRTETFTGWRLVQPRNATDVRSLVQQLFQELQLGLVELAARAAGALRGQGLLATSGEGPVPAVG